MALGFREDLELMLQLGRACFREGLLAQAHRYFELAVTAHGESPEAAACLGYASHRLGNDPGALYWIRRALELEPQYPEARIYLANMLYDRGETEAALHHLERTEPDDHYDELGLWRCIELKKTVYRLPDDDPELAPWYSRLGEVAGEPDAIDMLLAEIEAQQPDGTRARSAPARAVRHAAHGTAGDAEAPRRRVAPGGDPGGPFLPRHLGGDPAADEGRRPRVGRRAR